MRRLRAANPIPQELAPPAIEPVIRRIRSECNTPRHTRWSKRMRRSAVAALGCLVVAVPALAATTPWQPILGHPSHSDVPAGTTETQPPASLSAVLAVLRRPQTADDRGAVAKKLLGSVGQEYASVSLPSIRLLTSQAGHQAVVVFASAHGRSATGGYEEGNELCLEYGQGSVCGNARRLRQGTFAGAIGHAQFGLVPDGVARVVLTFSNGQTRSAEIRDNFFWIDDVPVVSRQYRVIDPPPGMPSTTTHAGAERPAIRWLDSNGKQIGPPA